MRSEYLSPTNIRQYLEFNFPQEDSAFFQQRSEAMLAKVEANERSFEDYILVYKNNKPVWSFVIFPDGDDTFGIQSPKILSDLDLSSAEWLPATRLIAERLKKLNAKRALLRFTTARITQNLPEALETVGFKKHHDRIEYKTLLSELPNEINSPLLWKAVGKDGLTLEFAADVMARCSQGDPNWDSSLNTLESIKVDLDDEELYRKQDAIHIGYFNNEPAAFVFAQTNQETGWARLTYVGVVPEVRGKGLGLWMHRHGFEMLRAQGGTEYHGGTVSVNQPMIKTFKANGCKELRRVEDWHFNTNF